MSDENNPQENKPKSSRGWRFVMFASLALNVLVIGALAGAMLRPDGGGMRRADRGPAFEAGLGPFGAALDRHHRDALGADFRDRVKARNQHLSELRQNFVDMLGLLRADTFDADRLREKFSETQSRLNAQQQIGVEALIAQLEGMSSTERQEFADRVERSLRRMAQRRK